MSSDLQPLGRVTIRPLAIADLEHHASYLRDSAPPDVSRRFREAKAVAPDRTRIPLSIVAPKGMKLDGSHPALSVGYGAYGISNDLNYAPAAFGLGRVGKRDRHRPCARR